MQVARRIVKHPSLWEKAKAWFRRAWDLVMSVISGEGIADHCGQAYLLAFAAIVAKASSTAEVQDVAHKVVRRCNKQ
jgi:hypothetical protein